MLQSGRIARHDNSLMLTREDGTKHHFPVEGAETLHAFGQLDINSAALNFLGKQQVSVYFYDYHGNLTGSFEPRKKLLAGRVLLAQAKAHLDPARRLGLARAFVRGAGLNMGHVLRYYARRRPTPELERALAEMEAGLATLDQARGVEELMGMEGNLRRNYYAGLDECLVGLKMGGRSYHPPLNEVNALVSFGNMLCYAACLRELHKTTLEPTLSFLHEPGERRFSLALDLAEVFKPLLVDRLVLTLVNKGMLKRSDFIGDKDGVLLKDAGRKVFLKEWDQTLKKTMTHRKLKRKVSARHLIRLEAYKLVKDLIGDKEYRPHRAAW